MGGVGGRPNLVLAPGSGDSGREPNREPETESRREPEKDLSLSLTIKLYIYILADFLNLLSKVILNTDTTVSLVTCYLYTKRIKTLNCLDP